MIFLLRAIPSMSINAEKNETIYQSFLNNEREEFTPENYIKPKNVTDFISFTVVRHLHSVSYTVESFCIILQCQ